MISKRRWSAVFAAFLTTAAAAAMPGAAGAVALTEFATGAGSVPRTVVAGPDGNVWYPDSGTPAIGRVKPDGTITKFTTANGLNPGAMPNDMVLGSDGNLWFADAGTIRAIGRITPSGAIHEFPLPDPVHDFPDALTLGPDGNIWFIQGGLTKSIDRITPSGTITETSAGLNTMSQPNDLTVGDDGNLWFSEEMGPPGVGRVTPGATPTIQEFSTGILSTTTTFPSVLTAGADGNIYFADAGESAIGRAKPDGSIHEFKTGMQSGAQPDALTAGPDGNTWFIDQLATKRAVGRIKPDGTINEFTSGLSTGIPDDITVGPDGNFWVPQEADLPASRASVSRITPAGVVTNFTAGLNADGGGDGDTIIQGPDGDLWFNDQGPTKAIARVDLQLPTATPTPTPAAGGGTPPPPAATTTSTSATLGTQKITLTTPAQCTAKTATLTATLTSVAINGAKGAALHFKSATFTVDKGVRKVRSTTTRVHGKKKITKVVSYAPNATAAHVPVTEQFKVAGLASGSHALKVKLSFKKTVTTHGHKRTTIATKTLTTKVTVC